MARTTPMVDYIVRRVSEGPVRYSELVTDAAALVPPGQAYRAATIKVERGRVTHGYQARIYTDADRAKDKRIRHGQRSVASTSIHHLTRNERLIQYQQDGVRMVAKGPKDVGKPSVRVRLLSPYTKELLRVVRDGPVSREDAIRAASLTISVEHAIRRAGSHRVKERAGSHSHRLPDTANNFWIGSRKIVGTALSGLVQAGWLTVAGEDAERMVGKGPKWFDPDLADVG